MKYDRPSPDLAEPSPTLWDSVDPPEVIAVIDPAPDSHYASWLAFHEANPWVYEALRRLALDLRQRGRTRMGIGMLAEVVRWQFFRTTSDESSDFKLNNNYRACYARLLMRDVPELAGVFSKRRSESDAYFEDVS